MQAYQADIAKFEANETQVLGVSMDSSPSNRAFAEKIGVKFPLLSDWRRNVTKQYGLYNEASGYGNRATFVVDKNGIIQHIESGRTAIDPSGAYEACDLLQKRKEQAKPQ